MPWMGGEGNRPKVTHRWAAGPGLPESLLLGDLPQSLPSPPRCLRTQPVQIWVWRKGLLGPTLLDLFFQDENLLGFPLDLKTYVYLGTWSPMAKGVLQPAHNAGPRGSCRSPRPVSLGTLPSNQSSAKVESRGPSQLLPRIPAAAHAQLFGPV